MPSCTIYNRSAFFQLHHNNAAWWRSEWFGDSTIGLLNVFAKKNCPKARSNRPNTELQDDERDQKSLLIYSSITAKIYFCWPQREVIFPYQYFCPKLSATLLTYCCINRVVEKLINLKLIYWSFQMWLLIIWGTNWTQGFHHWFKRRWLIVKPIMMARMLPKHWSCDISRYYLGN